MGADRRTKLPARALPAGPSGGAAGAGDSPIQGAVSAWASLPDKVGEQLAAKVLADKRPGRSAASFRRVCHSWRRQLDGSAKAVDLRGTAAGWHSRFPSVTALWLFASFPRKMPLVDVLRHIPDLSRLRSLGLGGVDERYHWGSGDNPTKWGPTAAPTTPLDLPRSLGGLRELSLSGLGKTSSKFLKAVAPSLHGLTSLAVNDCPLASIAFLAALPGLQELQLTFCDVPESFNASDSSFLQPLVNLPMLTKLDLSGMTALKMTSLQPLTSLKRLTSLTMDGVAGFRECTFLDLSDGQTGLWADILGSLPALQTLQCHHAMEDCGEHWGVIINDAMLCGLARAATLTSLDVVCVEQHAPNSWAVEEDDKPVVFLTTAGLTSLRKMVHLERLTLRYQATHASELLGMEPRCPPVSDIEEDDAEQWRNLFDDNFLAVLPSLPKLKHLEVQDMQGCSAEGLAASLPCLTNLTNLHLSWSGPFEENFHPEVYNFIFDLDCVSNLNQLHQLGLNERNFHLHFRLQDLRKLAGLTRLRSLRLGGSFLSNAEYTAGLGESILSLRPLTALQELDLPSAISQSISRSEGEQLVEAAVFCPMLSAKSRKRLLARYPSMHW